MVAAWQKLRVRRRVGEGSVGEWKGVSLALEGNTARG